MFLVRSQKLDMEKKPIPGKQTLSLVSLACSSWKAQQSARSPSTRAAWSIMMAHISATNLACWKLWSSVAWLIVTRAAEGATPEAARD